LPVVAHVPRRALALTDSFTAGAVDSVLAWLAGRATNVVNPEAL
jgi:hypothetical protein